MEQKIRFTRPQITEKEIELINQLISEHPDWGRTKLSQELCRNWNWCFYDGRPKEISCRDLLRDLAAKDKINLPARAHHGGRKPNSKDHVQFMLHCTSPITCNLKELLPLTLKTIERGFPLQEFKSLVAQYHYLSFDMTAGENIKYMVYSRNGELLTCLLFGASAWSCAPRDNYIGWDALARRANLTYSTNNIRFLVVPWVKVPHLASHILGLISRRISSDWQVKYGHPVHLLETFVEKDRFKATCYKAANWIYVGETTGRSRNDRYSKLSVPIKGIYLYPLSKNFREVLCNAPNP